MFWSGQRKVKVYIFVKNFNGQYRFGQSAIIDYVSPQGNYIVYLVNTAIDSWFEIIVPEWDAIGETAQDLLDNMEDKSS